MARSKKVQEFLDRFGRGTNQVDRTKLTDFLQMEERQLSQRVPGDSFNSGRLYEVMVIMGYLEEEEA